MSIAPLAPTKRWWFWGCAVVWVATRNPSLADGLVTRRVLAYQAVKRVLREKGLDEKTAATRVSDAVVALHTACADERLRGYAVVAGKRITVDAAAWVKGSSKNAGGGVSIDQGRSYEVIVGGVEPLFRPEDVVRVFPAEGRAPGAIQASKKDQGLTAAVRDIASRRMKEGETLLEVVGKRRSGLNAEMRAILSELPPGMSASPATCKKVLFDLYPTSTAGDGHC